MWRASCGAEKYQRGCTCAPPAPGLARDMLKLHPENRDKLLAPLVDKAVQNGLYGSGFDARTCPRGVSYTLGGQTWVLEDRDWRPGDGHTMLFRNKAAPQIARWVHPDELQHLHQLGVVTVA